MHMQTGLSVRAGDLLPKLRRQFPWRDSLRTYCVCGFHEQLNCQPSPAGGTSVLPEWGSRQPQDKVLGAFMRVACPSLRVTGQHHKLVAWP